MRKIEIDNTGELRDHETKVPIVCPRISGQLNMLPCRTTCAFYDTERDPFGREPTINVARCKDHIIGEIPTEHGD